MFEKLVLARDLVHELLADDQRRNLVRLGRIIEELCDQWAEGDPDDVAALPDDTYGVQHFTDYDQLPSEFATRVVRVRKDTDLPFTYPADDPRRRPFLEKDYVR